MSIITVSREFGSGGREVGKRLADALGYAYYDREIVSAIARKTSLDERYVASALEGGLLPGLHLVAAMSSLGKTTLVLQMVANMAYQGHDVIFFSLEMSRLDLFAKNISRHGFELDMNYRNTKALSTAAIVSGEIHKSNRPAVKDHFQKAVDKYKEYADKLTVIEGACNIGAVQIKEIVDNFLDTDFSGDERHQRRIDQIIDLENRF